MSKAKKKGADGAGDDARRPGTFDDLPYAEESPAVQERAPSVGTSDAPSGVGIEADGEPEPDPSDRPARRASDHEDFSELSDDALADATLLVQNDLTAVERERDEYLDGLRRVQAEFENYRKRVIQQQSDHAERVTQGLVSQLLPVLDACDAAIQHGATDVAPVHNQLLEALVKEGLVRLDPRGEPFDPNFHDAVMHEAADDVDGTDGAVVAEVLRTGYSWKGRVLRPAMVKVKG